MTSGGRVAETIIDTFSGRSNNLPDAEKGFNDFDSCQMKVIGLRDIRQYVDEWRSSLLRLRAASNAIRVACRLAAKSETKG
jgi:hypothetical protein